MISTLCRALAMALWTASNATLPLMSGSILLAGRGGYFAWLTNQGKVSRTERWFSSETVKVSVVEINSIASFP
ncbi:hypothetical protein [Pseudomonas aeruginosa]|uniref:hypothetical protein n=1 Tax=Pseudomonas aeruginosa TaxID=287 RepID=UPI00071C0028|nr:hypothetical protein [Pseudomonas aeruginosa]KSR44294.1 hypothetical protein APB45_16575 [Pseudomonas aeruginosa]